ncbi:hypothetical protein AWB80_06199 [Caballeronia pedi]|uniref:Uncharacterized protein n=1 Tax=Caballeronia pedi TaxID=1777141 RepID=A0A158D3D1_9BURK|nr:hypothetical protein [Caballeronia pedi]SAK88870.1 hypothetical protein AWB80_06199 [Caballeronia pedi]
MTGSAQIQIERQAGGWVWIGLSSSDASGAVIVLAQSREAFSTHEEALIDAINAMDTLGSVSPPG